MGNQVEMRYDGMRDDFIRLTLYTIDPYFKSTPVFKRRIINKQWSEKVFNKFNEYSYSILN